MEHEKRYQIKHFKILCQCGEEIGYFNNPRNKSMEDIKKSVIHKYGSDMVSRGVTESNLHKTLFIETLPDFWDYRVRVRSDYYPKMWELQIVLRLRFYKESNHINSGEEIRGRCLKCNIRHDFPTDGRENILLDWIEAFEQITKGVY